MKSLPNIAVSIDIEFAKLRPYFGDLFRIGGGIHPNFPPTHEFGFEHLTHLQFDQVDDYFGVRATTDQGSDVPIWLYPLVDGEPVHHHPGPFDGLRLEYSILRNPAHRVEHFLRCAQELAAIGSWVTYCGRRIPDLSPVKADIAAAIKEWTAIGIVVGSNEAMDVDY